MNKEPPSSPGEKKDGTPQPLDPLESCHTTSGTNSFPRVMLVVPMVCEPKGIVFS